MGITAADFPKLAAVGPRAFMDYGKPLNFSGPFHELRHIGASAFQFKERCMKSWKADASTKKCSRPAKGRIELFSLKKLQRIDSGAFEGLFTTIRMEGVFPNLWKLGDGAFKNTGTKGSKVSFPAGLPKLNAFQKEVFADFYGELSITGQFPNLTVIEENAFAWTDIDIAPHAQNTTRDGNVSTSGGVIIARAAAATSSRVHFPTGLAGLLYIKNNAFDLKLPCRVGITTAAKS